MKNQPNTSMQTIHAEFVQSLPKKVVKLKSLTQDITGNVWDSEKAKLLMYEVHNLCSSSGVTGFKEINQNAKIAESIIAKLRERNCILSDSASIEVITAIDNLISTIQQVIPHTQNAEDVNVCKLGVEPVNSLLVLIVDDDQNFCESLGLQIRHLGYMTKCIYSLDLLEQSIQELRPNIIFLDIIFGDQRDAGLAIIKEIRSTHDITCPIVYMSATDDLESRLESVRTGSMAFLSKAYNLADLKWILDSIVPIQNAEQYKVLIIDDDKVSTEYCTAILEHAGIKVYSIDNPHSVFECITNFYPDVILLDMYMPEIDGFELASIIRQHQIFASLPIVIMSSETDMNKQFRMRSVGADDFILKPFKPHHLIDTILNRIKRSQHTKRMIYTDGLTGLMIFPKVKDQIEALMETCTRYNLDFSLALIDLDLFKDVNDKYGHLAGDQMLREFAEFLLSRARKSDMVTRYGGEEFAIVFPYTSISNAISALNSMREAFSRRLIHNTIGEFHISFSAGAAGMDQYKTIDSLISAADNALYKAKQSGRNNIKAAD